LNADIDITIKAAKSISSGQALKEPYSFEKTRLIVREMTDLLVLDLVEKGLMTDQIVLTIGYDRESLTHPEIKYDGPTVKDHYGRDVPKHAHGTENLSSYTSSTNEIMEATLRLFDRIMDKDLLTRRVNVVACHVISEKEAAAQEKGSGIEQLDLFADYEAQAKQREEEQAKREKEHNLQLAMLKVKKKYGKNAVLKGMNFEDGGTTIERNEQIGGHRKG